MQLLTSSADLIISLSLPLSKKTAVYNVDYKSDLTNLAALFRNCHKKKEKRLAYVPMIQCFDGRDGRRKKGLGYSTENTIFQSREEKPS